MSGREESGAEAKTHPTKNFLAAILDGVLVVAGV